MRGIIACSEDTLHLAIDLRCEYGHMYKMLVSYAICCCPETSLHSIPEVPARAMAVKARHGRNDFRRSA